MAGTLRVRRSRGALTGLLLVLLGIWGALIPFVGPYFHYAYSPDHTWTATAGRMWLEVLPGAVALAGGVVLVISRLRLLAVLGAWLAALGGAWFAVGGLAARRWPGLGSIGGPVGGTTRTLLEQAGFFTGLGVVIVFLAAVALGRLTVVAVADAEAVRQADAGGAARATSSWPRIRPVKVFSGRAREGDEASAGAAHSR